MSIKDADGRWIGFYLYDEDAERVVACIAACTGIPTDSLKEGAVKELVDVAESVIPSLIENNYIADVEALKTVLARFKEED
jgi:Mor family transcriptional regulator